MAYPDLCTLADVTGYLPGYVSNATTDTKLGGLITAESTDILVTTNLEFLAISPAVNPRSFDVDLPVIETRELLIGACAAITTITLKRNGTTIRTVDPAVDAIREPRTRKPWQPIRKLRFPRYSTSPVLFWCEDVVEIDGTWGYPAVPADIKEACAKMVVVRYLTDVAGAGTAFADSATGDINIGGLFVSAREVIRGYTITVP